MKLWIRATLGNQEGVKATNLCTDRNCIKLKLKLAEVSCYSYYIHLFIYPFIKFLLRNYLMPDIMEEKSKQAVSLFVISTVAGS